MTLNKKEKLILVAIFILFIAIRMPGLDIPYHLDEIKYASIKPAIWNPEAVSAHPPLTGIIYSLTSKLFGPDYFRATPLIFGALNFLLLFYFVNFKFGVKAALWIVFLFSISFYSVLASLMVDIDGQILPFFLLLSLVSYFKWEETINSRKKLLWCVLAVVAIIAGFLTKLSFVISFSAITIAFIHKRRKLFN